MGLALAMAWNSVEVRVRDEAMFTYQHPRTVLGASVSCFGVIIVSFKGLHLTPTLLSPFRSLACVYIAPTSYQLPSLETLICLCER